MGIDFGAKRVGLALSDESGRFASPYQVLANDHKLIPTIKNICEREKVGKIVIGESKNYRGEPNPIMKQVERFRANLAEAVNLPIDYEPEFLTSAAAARLPGRQERMIGKDEMLDARAAALILKTYLDKTNND